MTGADQSKIQFVGLMERYCQLGRLLPAAEDIDFDDEAEIPEIKTLLAEMKKTKSELDQLLRREGTCRD
jgi:hypothetical protein